MIVPFEKEPYLEQDRSGKILNTIFNYLSILECDGVFATIRYNLLSHSAEILDNGKYRKWEDADDSFCRCHVEEKYHIHSKDKIDDAFRQLLKKRQYHPIKEAIEHIIWDGVERLPYMLSKWLKCEDTAYTREVSRLIFAGGIHRLYEPGCKFDEMAVLIGKKQGEGKSTFVRWLAIKDEFARDVCEFEGQRGIEAIEGAWICEVSELLALTKTKEQEAIKAYLTRVNDSYRKPFDRRVTENHRQCIFIGTTNKEQFLTDKTGNRRFYPVVCNQTGYELFDSEKECRTDILQCWAEAKVKYEAGTLKAYADRTLIDDIKEAQQQAAEDDYRVGMVEKYLAPKNKEDVVCVIELWYKALGNENNKPSRKDSNELSLIMGNIDGWEKIRKVRRTEYGPQVVWEKKINANLDYSDGPWQ